MPPFDAHALVIGVSAYQHVGPLPQKPDAEDMAATLADEKLCAYPRDNVRLLLQEQATKAGIVAELTALAKRTTETSTVFLYFSGHGGLSPKKTCFLIPVDGKAEDSEELKETCLSGPELSELLRAIPASKLTVVLDCCHAAGAAETSNIVAPKITADSVSVLAQGIGRAVLAASRVDGSSFAWPEARNGIFTGHLLAGLRGGVVGAGGVIRICQLYDYAQQHTRAEFALQRPVFKAEIEEDYPVALYRGGAKEPLVLPELNDGSLYDAFLSVAKSDADWARAHLVEPLERLGLKLCLEERDFRLGAQRLKEMERAVTKSRYTLCVMTPEYLKGPFEEFQKGLASFLATETKTLRFVPLLARTCELSLMDRMAKMLDLRAAKDVPAAVEDLALKLRRPPGRADD